MANLVDQHGRPIRSAAKEAAIGELKAEARRALTAAYDAAQTTAENAKHWRFADDLSAAAANSLSVRSTLRKRSRYECLQSNSFGCGMTRTLANDFVSTGPRLQIQTKDRELARRIESAWHRWCKQVKLTKKLRTARLARCIDGEAFLVAITNPRIRGPVQLDIRGIECDQISTPGWIDGQSASAVDGIRFDTATGDPIQYDLLQSHPGDRGMITPMGKARPLDPTDVIHVFNEDRPGQVRGIPELTPSLPLFAYLRRFTLATVSAAELAASFAAVLKTQQGAFEDEGNGEIFKPFTEAEFGRAMMAALPYGYDLEQFEAKHPSQNYREFRDALLCEIARPIHMPRNKVLGDSSGYNFSSAKMDERIYYHAIEVERADWDIDVLDRIFEWWLDEALMVPGLIDMPPTEYVPRRWTWPQPASINPLADANAVIKLRDAGLMLEEDYLHRQQIDPDQFYEARARQEERRAKEAAKVRTFERPTSADVPQPVANELAA